MQALLTSPRLIDLVIAFTVIEAIGLIVYLRQAQGLRSVVGMVAPGIFLLLAIRAALAGAAWPWVPAALGGALLAHLLDVRLRFRK